MALLASLASLALRPLLPGLSRVAADVLGYSVTKPGIDAVEKYVISRFTDQSREELHALANAAERAWKVLEIALGGPSLMDRLKRRGEDKALAKQLRAFLDANPLQLPAGQDERFRKKALAQLREARAAGLIPGTLEPRAVAQQTAAFLRFTDRAALCEAEWQAARSAADELLAAGHKALAGVLSVQLQPNQPPLLAVTIRYFFRSEIKNNPALFHGVMYDQVDSLSHELAAGFDGLVAALEKNRAELDESLNAIVVKLRA